jgi:hypothetical protein
MSVGEEWVKVCVGYVGRDRLMSWKDFEMRCWKLFEKEICFPQK